MEKRRYRNSNEDISLLGLGCMRFPQKTENGKTVIDREKATQIVDYAYSHGVNYFDTAYRYHNGESEDFVGEALSKYPRESFYLATKFPSWAAKESSDVEKVFREQLQKLRTDYIDFYLLHALDDGSFERCEKFGAYEFFSKMKKEGKIRHLGFSFHDSPDVLSKIVKAHKFDFAQLQLNYVDWEMQDAKKQYEILCENNIQCIVMEPVRGGALANPSAEITELFKKNNPGMSVASWAIRFAASLPDVLAVLSGMSNMEQVIDNVKTITEFSPLSETEKAIVKKASEIYRSENLIPCTGCRYCMDCPSGVDIPKMFSLYNDLEIYRDMNGFKEGYLENNGKNNAANCVSCCICVEKCPQGINIPKELLRVKARAEK